MKDQSELNGAFEKKRITIMMIKKMKKPMDLLCLHISTDIEFALGYSLAKKIYKR